uniref:Phosphate-selective porin O and P n=1 Tax=Roseihalotalea indica TaxID=2867963 RepID=A0AA49GQI5_9BACT|nr:hypothetical protein K4G66_07895 [Tunicatimonas sp. TK19036]
MRSHLIHTTILLLAVGLVIGSVHAQADLSSQVESLRQEVDSYRPGKSRFLLRGYAHAGIEYHEADDELSFVGGAFNPLFIYRQSDRLIFEGELEFGFEDGELEIGLEYANISYLLTDRLTVRLGKLFVPFGIFTQNLHPAWINKFPNFPLGYGHDGVLPGTDLGIELRGGAYLGNLKYNYSFYTINGPQLDVGEDHEDDIGKLIYDRVDDNNKNKAVGGRIGIFPFHDSSLELGFSGLFGKVGGDEGDFNDVRANFFALDLNYVKSIPALKSVVDFKVQANFIHVDRATYENSEDPAETFSFNNESNAYFVQGSIRPSFVSNNFIRNLELAVRYSDMETPEGALWGNSADQWDIGLNYWLDWRTVFKVTFRKGGEGAEESEEKHESFGNAFFFHWAIGF